MKKNEQKENAEMTDLDPAFVLPSERIGRYRLVGVLGHGSLASVFLAHDPVLDREVVLKIPNYSHNTTLGQQLSQHFLKAARAMARMHSAHIVTVHDVGVLDGKTYMAMEYLHGQTLQQLIWDEERISYVQIADLLGRVARALDDAHQQEVIHGDLKPANIFLQAKFKPKILDFGLLPSADWIPLAQRQTAGMLGAHIAPFATPYYLSPEYLSGKEPDARSDIYALGVILYELLTRKKPFSGARQQEVFERILQGEVIPPQAVRGSVPLELALIAAHAMQRDPRQRYQNAAAMARDLARYAAKVRAQKLLERAQKASSHAVVDDARPEPGLIPAPTWKMSGGHWWNKLRLGRHMFSHG